MIAAQDSSMTMITVCMDQFPLARPRHLRPNRTNFGLMMSLYLPSPSRLTR